MRATRLATMEDLAHAPQKVAVVCEKEGFESTHQKRETALRSLLEGSPHGAVYTVGPGNAPMSYVVLTFIWSVEYGGLKATVDDAYWSHSVCAKGIGKSTLKQLFRTIVAHDVNRLRLSFNQKNWIVILFYKTLWFRSFQNYKLIAMEV